MFNVCASSIEVTVVGNHLAGTTQQFKKYSFAGPALMRGQNVRHAREILHHLLETEPAFRTSVRLIPAKHSGPLLAGHGRCATIGEQIDQDILGGNQEWVEVGLSKNFFALVTIEHSDWLDHLDAERLNNRLHGRTPWHGFRFNSNNLRPRLIHRAFSNQRSCSDSPSPPHPPTPLRRGEEELIIAPSPLGKGGWGVRAISVHEREPNLSLYLLLLACAFSGCAVIIGVLMASRTTDPVS